MEWGSFAGGLANGLGQSGTLATQMAALQDARRLVDARRAAGNALMADPHAPPMPQPMPQPPMPGQASMPAGPQMGPPGVTPDQMTMQPGLPTAGLAPAQIPAQMGMPPMGGGGMDSAPPLPQPLAAPPMPDPGAQPPMSGGETPNAGPAPAGDDGLSAAPDPIKDAQTKLMQIAQGIKAANPGIDPATLFDATSAQIEQMKGVHNDVKDYMMGQIEMAKAQVRMAIAAQRVQGNKDVQGLRNEGNLAVAGVRGDTARDVAGTQAGARRDAARIGADSRRDVATTGAGARVQSARIGADSRGDVARTNRDARDYSADQGYRRGVDSATALTGGTARVAPGPRYRTETAPLNGTGAKPATAATSATYSSLGALQAAVKAGKLPRDRAIAIAKQNRWVQ